MATVREVIDGITFYAYDLHIIEGNPYYPAGSDRTKDIVLIPFTDGNALTCADAVCESNHRVLEEAWGDLDAFTTHNGGYSMLIALFLDEEAPEDLESTLESLEDYPVLCEFTYSEVEQEWMEEAWESHGRFDVRRFLSDDLDEITSDADIDDAYSYWCRNSDYGPYLEGDALVFDAEAIAEGIRIMALTF